MLKRGENKNYYHFLVLEKPEQEGQPPNKKYFITCKNLIENYGIKSRGTVYRLINNPEAKTRFPHKIERITIHKDVINFIENN